MTKKRIIAALAFFVAACCATHSSHHASAAENWKTGDGLKRELAQPVGVTWSNSELRPRVEALSNSRRVALVLDRRVDPNQKIELSFDGVSLAEAWQRIASRIGMGATQLGPVIYIGPSATVDRLRTVLALRKDDAAKLQPTARQRWSPLKPWQWDAASPPRDLLDELARSAGIRIDKLDLVPADLWAAGDLPPLALPERLTLVLAQFDLTYDVAPDGLSIRLVPLPDRPVIERTYPLANASVETLRASGPLSAADLSVRGKTLVVRGTQEQQDLVAALLAGNPAKTTTVKEGRKVYTLNVPIEKPASSLLAELATRLNWELQMDRGAIANAGLSIDKLVTVNVKDATEDELLRAILDPAGLTFRRRGNVVEVKPK